MRLYLIIVLFCMISCDYDWTPPSSDRDADQHDSGDDDADIPTDSDEPIEDSDVPSDSDTPEADSETPPDVRVIATEAVMADGYNVPFNTVDDDYTTRWSGEGDGVWISYELSEPAPVSFVQIAFFRGDQRHTFFEVETSMDGVRWAMALSRTESSGKTLELETYKFPETLAQYVRFVGFGNDDPTSLVWSSYTEVRIQDFPIDIVCETNMNECGLDGCGGFYPECTPGDICVNGACQSLPSIFFASFESGETAADIGEETLNTSSTGFISVVENPLRAENNTSERVLRMEILPGDDGVAEYRTQRHMTAETRYIYRWKQYMPDGFYDDATIDWLIFSQWDPLPCDSTTHPGAICPGRTRFNDLRLDDEGDFEFRFRAEPDCYTRSTSLISDQWNTFILDIFWTTTTDGYFRLYRNGYLVTQRDNVRTLFFGFPELTSECDLFWTIGLSGAWSGAADASLVQYIDDMAIFDVTDGSPDISEICPRCVD